MWVKPFAFLLSYLLHQYSFDANVHGLVTSHFISMKSSTILPIISKLNNSYKVVLASASPRRRELLQLMGLHGFEIMVSSFSEDLDHGSFSSAGEYCLATATKKIEDVVDRINCIRLTNNNADASSNDGLRGNVVVIGADTVVEVNGSILEKPKDDADSLRMLHMLNNNEHYVHTAVVVFSGKAVNATAHGGDLSKVVLIVETTAVTFCQLTDADLTAYIATGEGKDKSGSYGIQGIGSQKKQADFFLLSITVLLTTLLSTYFDIYFIDTGSHLVKSINGCYFNVMGLPINALSTALSEHCCLEA